jgi:hypothetical protein
MNEQEQILLKELLQKKLYGTLTKEEEQMLFDLSAKKTGRAPSQPSSSSNLALGISALNKSAYHPQSGWFDEQCRLKDGRC